MQIIIAPARKMQVDTDSFPYHDLPRFIDQTEQIVSWMKGLRYAELREVWGNCSRNIADKQFQIIKEMDLRKNLTPAIIAFVGLQYQHMAPDVLSDAGLEYISKNLWILSGFYGVLRPFDGIVRYRLGMGDDARVNKTKNLYEFWGRQLADEIFKDDDLVLDLASKEYSDAIKPYLTGNQRMVKCLFGQIIDGKIKQNGAKAKMARGTMVRYLAENNISNIEDIKKFDIGGYKFVPEFSSEDVLAFAKDE
ncbi:MAG: peroxide stress protein YaaA [Limosilactobacillus sp.]|uniref:peroxide stress protein YaaA n=1 Tax=Limosilactobacillus sp. TaxID=2773925 RepID=UPI0026F7C5DB|nr:peroxide stress protein YaaA [Limosilactobacillus sp.]